MEPLGRVGDLDVYRVGDRAGVPAGSLAVMAFHGQAFGALPAGTVVAKCNSEPGDSFDDGTLGTVLASARVPDDTMKAGKEPPLFGYYVAFQPDPVPCFISGHRITVAPDHNA